MSLRTNKQEGTTFFWHKPFLFLLAILPFTFALNPTPEIDLPLIRLLIPLLFILWLFEGLLKRNLKLDTRPRFFFLLFFLTISVFSLFWSFDMALGQRKALFLISVFPLYFVAYQASINKRFLNVCIKTLVWSGFLLCVFALFQFSWQFILGIDPTLTLIKSYSSFFLGSSFSSLVFTHPSWLVNISGKTIVRAFGSFPDPHLFSLYVNLLLPLVLFLFAKTKNRLYFFAFLLMLLSSLLSFSRASYLALFLSCLFFIFSSFGKSFIKKYFSFVLLTFIALACVTLIPNPLTDRFSSSFNLSEGSNTGRIEMWKVATEETINSPLRGIGIGNFPYLIDPSISSKNPVYAHNLFLDFAVETGVFNAFLLLLLVLSPIFFYRKNKNILSLAIASSFVIFITHSMFETPLFSIRVFPLFYFLLAIKSDD